MSYYKRYYNKKEQYNYPNAGNNAPWPVVLAIKYYLSKIPESVKKTKPLLYWLLGSGTPEYKMSPEDAHYQKAEGDQRCGNCEFAYSKIARPHIKICSQIRGQIDESYWCKLWQKPGTTEKVDDVLSGGLGDYTKDNRFDEEALQQGIKVELEHTDNPDLAKEIAKDHLMEDSEYYTKLKTIHKD